MINTYHKQRGVTAIGWVIILVLVGALSLVTIRLLPVYMEWFNVIASIESLEGEAGLPNMSKRNVIRLIDRRFAVNDVKAISVNDVKISKRGAQLTIDVQYEVIKPLFYNISFLVEFERTFEF